MSEEEKEEEKEEKGEEIDVDVGGREMAGVEARNTNIAVHSPRKRGVEVMIIRGKEEE